LIVIIDVRGDDDEGIQVVAGEVESNLDRAIERDGFTEV
jgi:hypothetical protein